MRENDGLRGAWHSSGMYWFCDCCGGGPLLHIHVGQGGLMHPGKPQSPNVSRCTRCNVLRPLKRDCPEPGSVLLHGIEHVG